MSQKLVLETEMTVYYGQIYVIEPGKVVPGEWIEKQVAQGFSYKNNTVSFGMPDHDGSSLLKVFLTDEYGGLNPDSIWAIQVPIEVTDSTICIGTIITEEYTVELQNGFYAVVFEVAKGEGAHAFNINISFIKSEVPANFSILKQGGSVTSAEVLAIN